MIPGVDPLSAGCWEVTATYQGATLTYVYWRADALQLSEIDVLNAAGEPGLVTSAIARLRTAGFEPRAIGDADAFGLDRSRIAHGADSLPTATELGRILGIANVVEDTQLAPDEVIVSLGRDYRP